MNPKASLGRVTEPEGTVLVVDRDGGPATSFGVNVERRTNVAAAIDWAARSRPAVVVLRVPLDEVARTEALPRLQAVAPECRVVLLPVGPVPLAGDDRDISAGEGAGLGLSPALPHDTDAVVRGRELRPRVESAGLARDLVRAACSDADSGDLCFDALLVTTEMVSNAVTHARTAVGLTVAAWPTAVRIEVSDRVSTRPVPRLADVTAGGGRGLALISKLCSAWGIDPSATGKTVWAQLVLSPSMPDVG